MAVLATLARRSTGCQRKSRSSLALHLLAIEQHAAAEPPVASLRPLRAIAGTRSG